MRVKLQLVICDDQGQQETVTDVITLNKDHQRIEQLGLTLADAKHLLSTLQRHLLRQQADAFVDAGSTCPDCGAPLKVKAYAIASGLCAAKPKRRLHDVLQSQGLQMNQEITFLSDGNDTFADTQAWTLKWMRCRWRHKFPSIAMLSTVVGVQAIG